MTTERPLGNIRMDRLRANGGGPAEPTKPGRHRRPVDTNAETTAVPADADRDAGR